MWLCAPRESYKRNWQEKPCRGGPVLLIREHQKRSAPIEVESEASTHHPMAGWCSALVEEQGKAAVLFIGFKRILNYDL